MKGNKRVSMSFLFPTFGAFDFPEYDTRIFQEGVRNYCSRRDVERSSAAIVRLLAKRSQRLRRRATKKLLILGFWALRFSMSDKIDSYQVSCIPYPIGQ